MTAAKLFTITLTMEGTNHAFAGYEEDEMVGGPMVLALGLYYLALASLVPFAGGLLGFSRRIVYYFTAALVGAFILLEAWTFPDELKYQSVYRLLLVDFAVTAVLALEFLLAFVLSHWLGAGLGAGISWVKDRLLSGTP